jgi:hypothetical protein
VGAGYVAVEMAGILHAFGTETTLLFRGETVLRYGYDKLDFPPFIATIHHNVASTHNTIHLNSDFRFVVGRLMQELQQNGPLLRPHSEPLSLSKSTDGISITLKDGSTQGPFDQVRSNTNRFSMIACKTVTFGPGIVGSGQDARHPALESCRRWSEHSRLRTHPRR